MPLFCSYHGYFYIISKNIDVVGKKGGMDVDAFVVVVGGGGGASAAAVFGVWMSVSVTSNIKYKRWIAVTQRRYQQIT